MHSPSHQTKQRLADLSGKPVNGISMQRLAPMFARQVVARREAEAAYDVENQVHPAFVDHLRAKAAKLLEKEAENTVSSLPVSSVYDALQITKRHKRGATDAGIRACRGMLTAMWKNNRDANITAEAFLKFKDHFAANFPKSAVSEVFDEIGAQGYAALPVADLLKMASRIYSQKDYDYEMTAAGLTSLQPAHVKARRFVLAVINGEADRPFDDEAPADHGMGVADWMVEREKNQAQGGDPDEWRAKNPAPKRGQVYNEELVDLTDRMYALEDSGKEDVRLDDCFMLLEMIQQGKTSEKWGSTNQMLHYITKVVDSLETGRSMYEDEAAAAGDEVDAVYDTMRDARRQALTPHTDEEIGAGEFAADMPSGDSSDRVLSWDDEYAISEEDLEELSQWHSSGGDPIYALSSNLIGGHDVPIDVAEDALSNLEQDWTRIVHEGKEDEHQALAGLIDDLSYWIKPY